MSRFAAVVLVLCLNISSAAPQTGDDIQQAKGEVASKLQVCSIYFRIGRSCLSLQEPALARSYGEMSDKVADLDFRAVGVSDEVYAAQESLYTEAMINAMRGDCTNLAWASGRDHDPAGLPPRASSFRAVRSAMAPDRA
jgi:hypothetical protein